jgi:hypothetical protein
MQILKLHNLPQIKPKTQCKFQKTAQSATVKPKKLMQILKLHNLPQINPKLHANFKTAPTFHRQTQKLMQISKLHNLPQTNPKLMQISKLIFRQQEKIASVGIGSFFGTEEQILQTKFV